MTEIRVTKDGTEAADEAESFSITDLCQQFGLTPRALRFYEEKGLIAPRRAGLARIYSRRDRARLAWILRGKRVGFSLSEIREMIDLYDLPDGSRRQRMTTIERCEERISLLEEQKRDIDGALDELRAFVTGLNEMDG